MKTKKIIGLLLGVSIIGGILGGCANSHTRV